MARPGCRSGASVQRPHGRRSAAFLWACGCVRPGARFVLKRPFSGSYLIGGNAMANELPKLFLARHGDTAWTDSHQHTGRTDLPLNERGEEHARQLGQQLREFSFVRVFTSPLQRAAKTCEVAGFGAVAEVDPDLIEWDYGRLEGTLTSDI